MTSAKQLSVAEFPRYEEYKDSGVEWLGEVPKGWECLRLGSFFNERRTKASDKDFAALSVTRNGIMPQLENAAKTKDGDNRKLVLSGDFVINSRSDRKGSSGVSNLEGTVSLINIVLEPKEVEPAFIHHLLKSYAFIEEYYRVGRGIVADLWTTRYDEMRTIILAMPSKKEQTLIAQFLDQKTALIDQAIAIKEQQIKLLNERKQIIIQQAVTQGLNPNAPMKDSGVEWIGQIPEHWEVKRIKHLGSMINGFAFPSGSFTNSGVRVVKISNIQPMMMSWKEESFLDYKWLNKSKRFVVEAGDLVFALTRPIISTGIKVAFMDSGLALLNQRNAMLKPSEKCMDGWFYFVFLSMSFIEEFDKKIDLTGQQPNISTEDIGNICIPLPPLSEQMKVVDELREQCSNVDKFSLLKKNEIQALKEYKTTLINSAVTGKIKITRAMLAETKEVSGAAL